MRVICQSLTREMLSLTFSCTSDIFRMLECAGELPGCLTEKIFFRGMKLDANILSEIPKSC
jgi:hypothetical protein